MLMNNQTRFTLSLLILLAVILTACGRQAPQFIAPEIEPPPDLIPSYVPQGFKLISGFQLDYDNSVATITSSDEDERVFPGRKLLAPFFLLKSPAGNDILGVHYQDREHLLLITKSAFPDGSLELWQEAYEAPFRCIEDCECDCDCFELVIGVPIPFRAAEIQEVRTIAGTQVAILKNPGGWVTVFMRGDYLLTVESDISLEENLKIVASLPGH
jgi:hypothetical protein